MNTPEQQAELFDKAAETIRMCAPHGIDPMVKYTDNFGCREHPIYGLSLQNVFSAYEFPVDVIEGQLVWADTVVYNCNGIELKASGMSGYNKPYTLTPPKQPLCEVEGKLVYKGDKLWYHGREFRVDEHSFINTLDRHWSWNQPKPKTVMVEFTVEDAEAIASLSANGFSQAHRIEEACRKALDNLKGDKS